MKRLITPAAIVVVAACWAAAVLAQQQPRAAQAQPPTQEQVKFFESRIRPIFAENCYQCHSPANGAPRFSARARVMVKRISSEGQTHRVWVERATRPYRPATRQAE